jgi:hypothetical protein
MVADIRKDMSGGRSRPATVNVCLGVGIPSAMGECCFALSCFFDLGQRGREEQRRTSPAHDSLGRMFEIVFIERICTRKTIGSCVDESSLFDARFLIRLILKQQRIVGRRFLRTVSMQQYAEA